MRFIFFTDHSTNASNYCLLNVKKYPHSGKKMYFIDPSVYELKNHNEYSNIEKLHNMIPNLKENEFISIDYPCDMNLKYSDEFIQKTTDNNIKYKDNPHYICTLQYKFQDINDFYKRLYYIEENIDLSKKIVGMGNLCRIMHPNSYIKEVIDWMEFMSRCKNISWMHWYGISFKVILEVINTFKNNDITISVDSTKWTKRIHKRPPLDKAICCRKADRNVYFLEYIKEIEKRTGIKVEY